MQPAVGVDRGRGRLRVVEVAGHHVVAAGADLADDAEGGTVAPRRDVGDLHLGLRQRAADRRRPGPRRVVERGLRDHGRRLGLREDDARAARRTSPRHGGRAPAGTDRAAGDQRSAPSDRSRLREARVVEQRDQHRRHAAATIAPRSVSIELEHQPRIEVRQQHERAPRRRACPSAAIAHPAVWNSGIGAHLHTSPGPHPEPVARRRSRALLAMPRWWSTAPFGRPVVPDVYWICAGSPGPTSGSRAVADPIAQKSSQSANETTSRSSGQVAAQRRRASRPSACRGTRRRGRRRGARLARARAAAPRRGRRVDRHERRRRRARRPTRGSPTRGCWSPTPRRARPGRSGRAGRGPPARTRSSSSPYVHRRRSSGSGDARRSRATASGSLAAAVRRSSPTVRSPIGVERSAVHSADESVRMERRYACAGSAATRVRPPGGRPRCPRRPARGRPRRSARRRARA